MQAAGSAATAQCAVLIHYAGSDWVNYIIMHSADSVATACALGRQCLPVTRLVA